MVKFCKLILALLVVSACAFGQNPTKPITGVYSSPWGTFTIGLDKNNVLTGNYFYFDQWDEQLKGYMRQDAFSMRSTSKDGNVFDVLVVADPYPDKPALGVLTFKDGTLTLKLPQSAFVNAAFEISGKDGHNVFPLTAARPYTAVMYINAKPGEKQHKAPLFDFNGTTFNQRKAYLVQGDIVYCLATNQNYTHIVYQNPVTQKSTEYWIQNDQLASLIP